MAEIWIYGDEVCALTGMKSRWVRKHTRSGKLTSRLAETSRNGKPQREYLLGSLSPAAQIKYARLRSEESFGGQAPATSTALVPAREADSLPLFSALERAATARPALPANLDAQAAERFRAITPLIDFKSRTNGHRSRRTFSVNRPTFHTRDGRAISNLNELAAYVAAQQAPPVSSMTIWRWLRRYRAGGFDGLADAPRRDKGVSRIFAEHPTAAAFVQHKYLKEGLTNAWLVWDALRREWPKLERRGEAPSYVTLRSYLNSLPRPLVTLAHQGAEKFHAQCSPYIQRSRQPVMDWWIADHRVHDVLVRNTVFSEMKDEQLYRLYLTAIYDWGSHKFVGYCFAPIPSWATICSALRMALGQYGFPKRFYWDNGQDFKKVKRLLNQIQISGRAGHFLTHKNVSFGVTSALPKRPRSKPIEAYFTRIARQLDPMWRPAYLGNTPSNCPADCRDAQKLHEEFVKCKRADTPLPTDAEFIMAAVQWIDEYNARPLESLDGHTPNEIFDQQFAPEQRDPVARRAMDVLLSDPVERTVLAGGCVEIQRMRYEPFDSSLGPMSLRQGRKVLVMRDPYNLAEAVALDPETHQVIGELAPQKFIDQDPNCQITQDMIRAEMRKQRALKRAYADYIGVLSAVASARGWKTERQALLERAGLRTGTDMRLLPAAPGARQPRQIPAAGSAPARRLAPAFVSDAVKRDADVFANVEVED